jgi:putative endonuclease
MAEHFEIGRKGEGLARDFLRKKGYKIVTTNYHCLFGEIDLIARDKESLVFIEVKTRTNDEFGPPQLAVTTKKQKKLIKIALNYIKQHHLNRQYCRFDVVAINLTEEGTGSIDLIKNAFSITQSKYF